MAERETWKSSLGFILAAVGSAVGLGNLWRFAYRASEGGGAAFVLLYLVIVAVVGVPLLTAEFVMGRHTRTSCVRALARVGGPRWKPLGVFFVLVGFGILSYYSVIMGWTARTLLDTLRGVIPEDTGAYFASIAEGPSAIAFHVLSMAITIAIVGGGVRKGIERASLVLLPTLGVLILGLAIWAATLSGGGPGYAFYLRPDFGELFKLDTLTAAAGQAFFSLSLGMGAMLTYASYIDRETNLGREAGQIALTDSAVAFVGGLVTFPIIYHFALAGAVSESTVGALFIALPRGFHALGATGIVVGAVFFIALYIAALTSAFSLLEVATAPIIDGLGWSRRKAVLAAGGAVTL
ncbi:MAG: sodium-dependent transporter, partial [Gemmatimonadota bacterium]